MERLYRLVFLALFVVGFVGAVASAQRTGPAASADSAMVSLIKSVRIAQETNAINNGQWFSDKNEMNSDTLAQVEQLFDDK